MSDWTSSRPASRSWRRTLSGALVLLVLALARPGSTHELPVTTGTLTLRAGHLELRLHVDLLGWMARLDVSGPEEPRSDRMTLRRKALETLVRELRVTVGEAHQTPAAIRFPAEGVVSRLKPGERVPLVVEFKLDGRPDDVTLVLPASLGDAEVQLIEPRVRTVRPGEPARFDLHAPPGDLRRSSSSRPHPHHHGSPRSR